jgi:succinate dehydrogenase / fumarate reductase, iron-sulfur subunit
MTEQNVHLRIRRQDRPDSAPYWQEFVISGHEDHNVLSLLMAVREHPVTKGGEHCRSGGLGAQLHGGGLRCLRHGDQRRPASCLLVALVSDLKQPIVIEPSVQVPGRT